MREAPSVALIDELIRAGAQVRAYDPVAIECARRMLPKEWHESGQLVFAEHQYQALEGADALVLVTEWKPFRQPDLRTMKRIMRGHAIFDGRNQYDPQQLQGQGFEYYGIGRANIR
jgi:UDPglucose 6-dehydrogenase